MTVVVAPTFVRALMDLDDPHHDQAATFVHGVDEDLVTTPMALAEMESIVSRDGGRHATTELRKDFERGAYEVRWWADALAESLVIAGQETALTLVDASLVALAARMRTNRIATFDPNFRSIMTRSGEAFVVLPGDA